MKSAFKMYSLQFLIAIASIVVSILPMTYTGLSVYSKYAKQLVGNSDVFTNQIMDQVKINIEEYIRSGIKANNDIVTLIDAYEGVVYSELLDRLDGYYASRNDIVSIAIASENGQIIRSIPRHTLKEGYVMNQASWFEELVRGERLYYISEPHVQNQYTGEHKWVLSIYKAVKLEAGKKGQQSGVLQVDISLRGLDEICNNLSLGGRGYVYITNQEKEIIYHPQQALIYSGYKKEDQTTTHFEVEGKPIKKQGKERLIITKPISFVDWNIVGVTYIKDIYEGNLRIAQEVMTASPLILGIIILLSWYISGRITQPIKELEKKMKKVQKGDLKTRFNMANGEKEVVELGKSFNIMVEQLNELVEENKREHEAKRISDLNALQAQINPHFLYNTLDSIMWMAESGRNEEVVEMVTALARLFRIGISKGRNIITVREEIEHARNYLMIQKSRYKDKFTFEIHVPEVYLNDHVPKIILQPLIENALYHGIEYMVDEGKIQIEVYQETSHLVLSVEDNGLGMMPEQVEKLLLKDRKTISTSGKGNGVGVANVNERIRIRYGEAYGITIRSEREVGTRVEIHMPLIGGEVDE